MLAALSELRALGWSIPEIAIRRGLAQVHLPARVEIMSQRPTVVIDAAHNVASIRSLLDTLAEQFPRGPRILIFGTTRDKDMRGMLELLLPQFETVIFTRYSKNPARLTLLRWAESPLILAAQSVSFDQILKTRGRWPAN